MSRAKTTPRPEPPARALPRPLRAYLACFFFDEFSDLDREGEFQIVVQAQDVEQAVERCRALLKKLRAETTLFDRPCSIYCKGVLELPASFEEGVLVNFISSRIEGHRSSIECLVPEQKDDAIDVYEWAPDSQGEEPAAEQEDTVLEPFVDFGGQGVRDERNALHEAQASKALTTQARSTPRDRPQKVTDPREDEAQKAARARREALAQTLRELDDTRPRPRRPPTK